MRWIRLSLATATIAVATYLLWPIPEPDRARRAVEAAVAAFSQGRVAGCIDSFDLRFTDESVAGRRIDRDTIRAGLLSALGHRRGSGTWHARLGDGGVDVLTCEVEAGRASTRFEVLVFQLREGAAYVDDAEPVWTVEVDADLERGEDRAWRFVRSSHRTLSGRAPYR